MLVALFAKWYLTSVHQPTITLLLVALLFGMLGLGVVRTIKKLNKKAGH